MLVHVRASQDVLIGAVNRHLEKRARAALGRLAARVSSVTVALSDVNGPRGGEDLHCSVTVELVPNGSVRGEATDSDLFSAVGRALARARRTIRVDHDRQRRSDKPHASPLTDGAERHSVSG